MKIKVELEIKLGCGIYDIRISPSDIEDGFTGGIRRLIEHGNANDQLEKIKLPTHPVVLKKISYEVDDED